MRVAVAAEMARVLIPNGLIVWCDIVVRNPRNRNVEAISRGEVEALFPAFDVTARRITLAPPVAHRIVRSRGSSPSSRAGFGSSTSSSSLV